MSKLDYQCTFNLQDCIKELGLDEKGRVQQFVTNEVLRLSDDYIPFDEGSLKDSGHIENDTDVVWGGAVAPYAHYMWEGMLTGDFSSASSRRISSTCSCAHALASVTPYVSQINFSEPSRLTTRDLFLPSTLIVLCT